jgi:hypothetical protein
VRRRTPASLLPAFACASVGAALLARVVHRGGYFPGWDVVGAANGLRLVATLRLSDLVAYYREHYFDPGLFWNVLGLPVALLPGALAHRWPWECWPHVVTPALVGVSLAALARGLALRPAQLWTCLLPIGASPAFLSYTVAGFPYVSNVLPYGLALWAVLRPGRGALASAVLGALAVALAFQVQELGRTVFVVFLAAAALLPGPPRRVRAVWLAVGVAGAWLALHHPTANTGRYTAMAVPAPVDVVRHGWALVRHFAAGTPDLPVLVPAGVIAALAAGRQRWFWSSLLLAHAGLLVLLAANSGLLQGIVAVWPRRTLLLSFLCAASCTAALRRPGRARAVLLALLVGGNAWQLADTARWARRPVTGSATGWGYVLPYTHTPLRANLPVDRASHLDSRVCVLCVDWYHEMRAALDAGRTVFLVYNLTSFDENATDPAGIIDRLYLRLGHLEFLRRVLVFGDDRLRVNELPIRPMPQLAPMLDALTDPSAVQGYWMHHPLDEMPWEAAKKHRAEVIATFTELARRFRVTWGVGSQDANGRRLYRFELAPLAGGAARSAGGG